MFLKDDYTSDYSKIKNRCFQIYTIDDQGFSSLIKVLKFYQTQKKEILVQTNDELINGSLGVEN